MKILYIGDIDFIAEAVISRLSKEGNDVYFLTNQKNLDQKKKDIKHRTYHYDDISEIKDIFLSVNPDIIIFAGIGYIDEKWGVKQKNNLSLLSTVLEECKNPKIRKKIFFSSIEVYENKARNGEINEDSEVYPSTIKGYIALQCEKMIDMHKKYHDLNAVVLRLSSVFSNKINLSSSDFFGNLFKERKKELSIQESYIQPIHSLDVADAVNRVISSDKSLIYNVCSSYQTKISSVVNIVSQEKRLGVSVDGEAKNELIKNKKLKTEQGWIDFWSLERLLEEGKIELSLEGKPEVEKSSKAYDIKQNIRMIVENIIIFIFFLIMYVLTLEHVLFSKVDWLLIYVIIISLKYNIQQGILAVVLASVTHLIIQDGSIVNVTNFYSYGEDVLVIIEFIFLGIIVGYTSDMLREEKRVVKKKMKIVEDYCKKLKEINKKNTIIKNEYEKRLLEAKDGISKLYAMIRKINVLDEDRIFMEVLNIVKTLMETDTVAVYKTSKKSNYLRLIATLNEESLMENRSWNLENHPEIREAIENNMIFQGDIWKKEPAIVLPLVSSKDSQAVIVIKELSFEQISLYSINTLRTLSLLVSELLEKAFKYDEAMHQKNYIKNTFILYPGKFKKSIKLAEEKKLRKIADYLLIKLAIENNIIQTYAKFENVFRSMDLFGTNESGELFVLLNNTSKEDGIAVVERLSKKGIFVEIVEKLE